MPVANQMPERPGTRILPQGVARPTLRYTVGLGMTNSSTPVSTGGTTYSQTNNLSSAKPSYTNSKQPAVPLFNPAELQFFKHFLQFDDESSQQKQSYKPQLLSSYRFLSSSLSAMTSTLTSFVNPESSPYNQPYVDNNIPQPDNSQISALYNTPFSLSDVNACTCNDAKNNVSVPPTTPVVQTNSFLRPQSAKQSSGAHGASVLNGPIVVESKPVSVSDQERDEESKRLQVVKSSVSNSSLPRPPSANNVRRDRNNVSSHARNHGTNINSMNRPSPPGFVPHQKNTSLYDNQKLIDDYIRDSGSTSPFKFYKSLVATGSVHKTIGVLRGPSPPDPPAVLGTAIKNPGVTVTRITKPPRIPIGNQTKHNSKASPRRNLSSSPSRNNGKVSPLVIAHRTRSSNLRSVGVPPETNQLLGTFLGHTKVRNLNYTPAKPYKDVVHTYDIVQQESPDYDQPTRPQISTVFYRKVSKPEESLYRVPKYLEGLKKYVAVNRHQGSYGNEEDEGNHSTDSEGVEGDDEDEDDDDEYEDAVDDEDDGIDGIEEDDDGEDGSDDGRSVASSHRSQKSVLRIRSATKRLLGLTISRPTSQSRPTSAKSRPTSAKSRTSSSHSLSSEYQPALTPSLFCNIPPTVNFVTDGYKVEQLPWDLRKLLKWRMSPITPNVVKNCIFRSHFRVTKKNHDWIGYWGKHMKSHVFKTIQEYQKVNHFPGSFQIGRKDKLWRNLSRYQVLYGKAEFNFFPQTFVLPFDLKLLKRAWEEGGARQKWIIKPPASARGIGIRLICKFSQIPKKQPVIVQRYLSRPYLINESKFDMRIYVYVTSYDPLRIYVYEDGLARFASVKYSHCMKNIANKYMHLTNYSINKKNQDYQSNVDETACQGHKWTLKTLWQYMRRRGVDTRKVWESMLDLIVKTIITSEACLNSLVKSNVHRRYSCHELFGFDIMLDETLKPWIIEVNISPSLHSNSPLDIAVKGGMISDLLNIAGFMIPDKKDVQLHAVPKGSDKETEFDGVCIDPRLYQAQLSPDERAKHAYYVQRCKDEHIRATILDVFTPDDIRYLTETIDEDNRKGDFLRVFPSPTSHRYHRFFEQPRYYNLLLDQWIMRYGQLESEGIYFLNNLCKRGIHLENPTSDPHHQWCQPLSHDRRAVSAPVPPKYGASSNLPLLRKNRVVKVNASRSWHGSMVPSSTKKKKRKGKTKTVKLKDEEEPEGEEENEET